MYLIRCPTSVVDARHLTVVQDAFDHHLARIAAEIDDMAAVGCRADARFDIGPRRADQRKVG